MKSRWMAAVVALVVAVGVVAPATSAQAAGTVRGTVSWHGTAVSGITVGWYKPSSGSYKTTKSAANGSYSLRLPGSGQKYVLFANLSFKHTALARITSSYVGVFYGAGDKRDFAFQTLSTYKSKSAGDSVNIELVKPGSISGTDPLLKGKIVYLQNFGGQQVGSDATAAGDGGFAFFGLVPGRYRLGNGSPYDILSVNSDPIVVTEGVRTVVDPEATEGAIIQGTATTAGGAPAADVYVEASNATGVADSTYTDSAGKYRLKLLTKSAYRVSFGTAEQSVAKTWVPQSSIVSGVAAGTPVTHNVTLQQAGRINGTVTFASKTKYYDHMAYVANSTGTIVASSYVSKTGAFSVSGLGTGNYTVTVTNSATGKYVKKSAALTVGKTVTLTGVSLTSTGAKLSGTVSGVSSAKYDYDNYVFLDSPSRPSVGKHYGKNGKFSLIGIVPGTYTVSVYATGRVTKTYPLTISASTTKNFAPGALYGNVKGKLTLKGKTITTAVTAIGSSPDNYLFFDLAKSRFTASGPAGKYTVKDIDSSKLFQPKTPLWVEFPKAKSPFSMVSGKTKNLGTVKLLIKR